MDLLPSFIHVNLAERLARLQGKLKKSYRNMCTDKELSAKFFSENRARFGGVKKGFWNFGAVWDRQLAIAAPTGCEHAAYGTTAGESSRTCRVPPGLRPTVAIVQTKELLKISLGD
jgi:hypothetical protein